MRTYLYFGLGLSGISAFNLLYNKKDYFYLFDDDKDVMTNAEKELNSKKNVFFLNKLNSEVLDDLDTIILSPGISIEDERLASARLKGIKIISELSIGAKYSRSKIISITGTNGKTTTTRLIHHILSTAGKKSMVAGNIGYPLTKAVVDTRGGYIVTEVSSFQLESSEDFKSYIGAILNISPDHLDRHKNMENYSSVKFSLLNNSKIKIINDNLSSVYKNILSKQLKVNNSKKNDKLWKQIFTFSCNNTNPTIFVDEGNIVYNNYGKREVVCSTSNVHLLGKFNMENVLCAVLIAKKLHIKNKYISKALNTFTTDRHRLEKFYELNGSCFFDDSKATNIDATIKAIATLKDLSPFRLLLGGSDKRENYDSLAQSIPEEVLGIYVCGDNRDNILSSLYKLEKLKNRIHIFDSFNSCVLGALGDLQEGENLLLSPASASFDCFKNYKERGDKFCQLVKEFYEKK